MRFRVELDIFAGPLDLLLYLVRKHEVEILQIPIADVTEQYLEILEVIEQIDVDAVGDFLEVATRLMEIKSQMILPRPEEPQEELEDPRADLVQRLLEYKRYKEAASKLEELGQQWQRRYSRQEADAPSEPVDPAEQPIQGIEIWDLVGAFKGVLKRCAKRGPTKIRYDDTPIEVHMQHISERVAGEGRLRFGDLFAEPMHRSQLVSMFLAVLELVRHGRLQAEQQELFGEIWLVARQAKSQAA